MLHRVDVVDLLNVGEYVPNYSVPFRHLAGKYPNPDFPASLAIPIARGLGVRSTHLPAYLAVLDHLLSILLAMIRHHRRKSCHCWPLQFRRDL